MITTRLYLDARQSKDTEAAAPLKLAIYWKKSESYIFTGVKLAPSQWDAKRRAAKDKAQQLSISRFKLKVDTILSELQESGRADGLTASGLKKAVERELSPASNAKALFMDTLMKFAASKKARTREIYMETYRRIERFDARASLLTFDDITIGWLDRFDSFLSKTSPKKNARNIHLRNIRAVFNQALKEELTSSYPFRKFEIRPEPTMKRDLVAEQLRKLFNADLPDWQRRYVDFFQISFLLIGMNTEDLIHAAEIANGRIEYRRAKTHRPYSIKVEEECLRLIEKYPGKKYLLDVLDTYSSTHNWTSRVDNALKAIADQLGLPRISMYWARHSWATIAAERDIPKDTIAAALGHSGNTVTDIYINFDRGKIDRANRQVMDFVLYDKKTENVFDLIRRLDEKMTKLA